MLLTGVDVGEQDERELVEGQQGVQHQPVDLDGPLDVSGDRVLQRHDVVLVLHLLAWTNRHHDVPKTNQKKLALQAP